MHFFSTYFMLIVCLRLIAVASNLRMQIDSPLCWVRLLWSAAICIWKWSGLEWAERRGAVRDDWERVLATISLKLCLPKCLQQHTSQRRFNFPVPIFCLSFYIHMCGFNCSPVQQCYILIPCPLWDLQADTISPLTVDYQSRATCHTERAVIKVIWVQSEINVTQTSQSLSQCSVVDCQKKPKTYISSQQ